MKRYCFDCGSPTEYILKKPVFCANCGNSFEKNSQASQVVIKNTQSQKPPIVKKINNLEVEPEFKDNIDYDDYDAKEVPNISSLKIEAPLDKPNRGVKLKDLMGTSTNENSKKERKKGKKVSKKQILEDFAKEAGSLRKNKK